MHQQSVARICGLLGVVCSLAYGQDRDAIYRLPNPVPQVIAAAPPPPEALESLWQIAISQDDRLSSHRWQATAAETSLSAAGAQRMPTAHLKGGYQIRDNRRQFVANLPSAPNFIFPYQQREDASFAATFQVPVYTSGRISHQIAAAAADLRVQEASLEKYRLRLKIDVAADFVGVLLSTNNLTVAESSTHSLESHSHDVRRLAKRGTVPKNDVLAAEVALANGRYEQIRANFALDRSRAALNRRLKRPLDQPISLAPPIVGNLDLDLPKLTSLAVSHRPELIALSAQAQQLKHQACSQQARNRVQVALEGGYSFQENRYQSPQGITGAGVNVSWNALNRSRDLRARSLEQQAMAMSNLFVDRQSRIELEVRQAWLHVREAQRRKALTRQAVLHADENLRVARKHYAMGTITNTEVLKAETLRVQANLNDNNASHDAVLAVLFLQRVVGTL